MKENRKIILLLVSLCCFFGYTLFHNEMVVNEVLYYTNLFIHKLFPTSFLFLVLSFLLIDYQFVFFLQKFLHMNSVYFYFFIMSFLSGFPTGAVYVKEAYLQGIISREDANRIIRFAHFPNPLFVLFTVSEAFNSQRTALILYSIIFFSNFILFIIYQRKRKISVSNSLPLDFSQELSSSIMKSFKIIILIYGTSLFFYLISSFIRKYTISSSFLYVFVSGLFDLTNGVVSSSILTSTFLQGCLLFFFIGFGSISIHFQIKSILSDTSISYHSFLIGRIYSLLICLFLWIIYCSCTV